MLHTRHNKELVQVLDDLKAAAFVVDIETHRVLYINPSAETHLGGTVNPGDPCWKALYDNDNGPCSFCKINELKKAGPDTVIKWEFHNKKTHYWYEIHDRLIEWEPGKKALLEISYIIKEKSIREHKISNDEIIRKFPYYTAVYEIKSPDQPPVIVEINEPGPSLHGYTKEELIGKPASFLDTGAQVEKIKLYVHRLLESGSLQFTAEHKRKDGSIINFQVDAKLFKEDNRTLIYIIAQDISSKVNFLRELYDSRLDFKLLSGISSDISFIYRLKENGEYETMFIGGDFKKLTGYEYDELKRIGGRDAIVMEEDKHLLKDQVKVLLEGKSFKARYRIRKKDGTVVWLEDNSVPVKSDDKNHPLQVYNTVRDITKEKKAQQEIERREKRYADLYNLLKNMSDNADDMIWAKDMDNKFTFVNKAIAKKLLNAKDTLEPLGKNERFFVARERAKHPDEPRWFTFGEDCGNSDEVVKQTGKPGHFDEYGNVMGKFLYLDVYKAPLRDEQGKMIGTVGFARDITRLKEIEKELKKNLEKFRGYLNALPVAIVVINKKGDIVEVNPETEKLTGESENALLGKNIADYVMPENLPALDKGLKILGEKGFLKGEADFNLKERNAVKHLKYHGLQLEGDNYIVVLFDVTAQQEAENILRLNEQRYRTVFENLSNIAVQAYDKNRRVIFWNDTSTVFYGYTKQEAMGRTFEELIIPEEKKEWTKIKINEWLLQDKQTNPGEYLRRKKNGKVFSVYSSFIKIKNYNGETEFFSLDIDLTEIKETELKLKKALEELREANQTKDKMFSIIAHDLRAPFNSLLGFTELLIEQYDDLDKEDVFEMIKAIKKNSEIAFDLLNNLLHWSRQQLGTIRYSPTLLFVHRTIENVIKSLQGNINEKSLKVINNIDKNAFAYCDEDILSVVVRNLLSNAIKFTPKGGTVTITSESKKNRLWINITDSGVGMDRDAVNKILGAKEGFTTKGTEGEKGTGLGLMLVQSFVKLNKGDFKIKSEPGKGSTFGFSLPISRENGN